MGSAGTIGSGTVLLARWDMRIFWASLGMVGALIVGAVIIGMVERWRKRSVAGPSAGDQLSHFRELYEQGTITREEFERIRGRLAGKLRDELKLAPPAAPAAPSAVPADA